MGSKHVFRDTSNSLLGTNNFLVERKIAFRGAASDHSQAKQTSLLQRFELFCTQGFERTVSDSDYENTVKIIGCDSHDKRNSSFSEVSVTDGPAKVSQRLLLKSTQLRAIDSKYGESNDSSENSDFLLLRQKDPFDELFSEIYFKSSSELTVF